MSGFDEKWIGYRKREKTLKTREKKPKKRSKHGKKLQKP